MCHTIGVDSADVVVIGAGVVGAACAYFLAQSELSVVVVDRDGVAAGTTGAGEGNILVSDKELGPELQLALLSNRLWRELGAELGQEIELEELWEDGTEGGGGRAVALIVRRWRWEESGELAATEPMAWAFELRHGRVLSWRSYEDRAAALCEWGFAPG